MNPHAFIPNMRPAPYMKPCEQEGCGEIFTHPNHRGYTEEDFDQYLQELNDKYKR